MAYGQTVDVQTAVNRPTDRHDITTGLGNPMEQQQTLMNIKECC